MLALALVSVRLAQALVVRALASLEEGLTMPADADRGRCHECEGVSFTIANFDNPEAEGTVQIDGAGNATLVEGLLFCAHCGELFDPDANKHEARDRGHLRLVADN